MKRRITSFALAAALVISLLPGVASAAKPSVSLPGASQAAATYEKSEVTGISGGYPAVTVNVKSGSDHNIANGTNYIGYIIMSVNGADGDYDILGGAGDISSLIGSKGWDHTMDTAINDANYTSYEFGYSKVDTYDTNTVIERKGGNFALPTGADEAYYVCVTYTQSKQADTTYFGWSMFGVNKDGLIVDPSTAAAAAPEIGGSAVEDYYTSESSLGALTSEITTTNGPVAGGKYYIKATSGDDDGKYYPAVGSTFTNTLTWLDMTGSGASPQTITATLPALSEGSYEIKLYGIDASGVGCPSSGTQTVAFSIDATAPTVKSVVRCDGSGSVTAEDKPAELTNTASSTGLYFLVTYSEGTKSVGTGDFAAAVSTAASLAITSAAEVNASEVMVNSVGTGTYTKWVVKVGSYSADGDIKIVPVVNQTAVDIAGNELASATLSGTNPPHEKYVYDATAPDVTTWLPANSATDVPMSGNIVITMDEVVKMGDVENGVVANPTTYVNLGTTAGTTTDANTKITSVTLNKTNKTVTIAYSGLATSTEYTVSLLLTATTDLAGNALAATKTINFTTMSGTAVAAVDGEGNAANPAAAANFADGAQLSTQDIATPANLNLAGIKIVSADPLAATPDKVITGTWAWKTSTDTVSVTDDTMTAIFTPVPTVQDGVTYAATEIEVKVFAVKKITVTNGTASATTATKTYDGNAAIPAGKLNDLKAAIALSGVDASHTATATIDAINAEFAAVTAGTQNVTLKSVTLAGADAAHYILTCDGTNEFDATHTQALSGVGNIAKAAAVIGNTYTMTVGTGEEHTTPFTPSIKYNNGTGDVDTTDSLVIDLDGADSGTAGEVMVYYWVVATPAVYGTACDCGAANTLAHATDCAYVTDGTHAAACDCGALAGIDHAVVHTGSCPQEAKATDTACTCGAGDVLSAHAVGCAHLTPSAAEIYGWVPWENACNQVNAMAASATVKLKIFLPNGTTNLDAVADLGSAESNSNATLAIQAAYVPPSGGGVSSYTVKYDVGTHGKLAEGAKSSESVNYNKSPKSVPEVVANEGWKFLGWSLDGKTVVDPTGEKITKSTTFTALYEDASHTPYIIGIGDGRFAPEGQMTRAEAVTMLARLHPDWKGVGAENLFNDVADDAWYAPYVTFATAKGITEGVGDDLFAPERAITRGEMAALLVRYMGLNTDGLSGGFTDTLGNWADRYVTALKNAGIADGYGDGTFKPDAGINRSEAVKLINGAVGRTPDKELVKLNTKTNPFIDVPESHWAFADVMEAALEHHISDYHTQSDK